MRDRSIDGNLDPFVYRPLGWSVEYAGLPSGHATNACAAAIAIGALWPRSRPFMWAYALVIAISRVVMTAHHPSDVLAGAIAGTVGALLVRDWFAARGLGFALGPDGRVVTLPARRSGASKELPGRPSPHKKHAPLPAREGYGGGMPGENHEPRHLTTSLHPWFPSSFRSGTRPATSPR